MVKRRYPKPKPVGRPRICEQVVKEIRWYHFRENRSYNWIAWKLSVSPSTCKRYCTGEWKGYFA